MGIIISLLNSTVINPVLVMLLIFASNYFEVLYFSTLGLVTEGASFVSFVVELVVSIASTLMLNMYSPVRGF